MNSEYYLDLISTFTMFVPDTITDSIACRWENVSFISKLVTYNFVISDFCSLFSISVARQS
jgi:hypothetical protein